MSRPVRITLILLGIVLFVAALIYAAQSMNLIGLLLSMHTPPRH